MKNKVTGLELSKKLKSLGVKQESEFYWFHWWKGSSHDNAGKDVVLMEWQNHSSVSTICSAFLSCELGELLPHELKDLKGNVYKLSTLARAKNDWSVSYINNYGEQFYLSGILNFTHGKTESEARGKMLVYLIENQLM